MIKKSAYLSNTKKASSSSGEGWGEEKPQLHKSKLNPQSGNVLWLILITVALLGALTFTLSRSNSSSSQSGNIEKQSIEISRLLRYAKSVEVAVNQLKLNGCSENDLSFWHDSNDDGVEDVSDDYYNANSPTDRTCHIFHTNGAGLTWTTFSKSLFDEQWNVSPNINFAKPFYLSLFEVVGVGKSCSASSCSELVFIISDLKLDTCKQLNRMLSIGEPEIDGATNYNPQSGGSPQEFDGSFRFINTNSILGDVMTELSGKKAGCFLNSPGGNNTPTFYHVLLTR